MDQDPSEALAFFVRKLQGPTRPATASIAGTHTTSHGINGGVKWGQVTWGQDIQAIQAKWGQVGSSDVGSRHSRMVSSCGRIAL
jgi:hypothetical protein